ncbi:YwbE family protein [Patescibacteria group bacterium]|nr:YwbE family protein [Patescibacteria group bacterium]
MSVGGRYPKPGEEVRILQKTDYQSGNLTIGIVKDVLTKKRTHSRGHKVRLTSGIIGRVQSFSDDTDSSPEPPKPDPTPEPLDEYDLI